MELVYRTFLKNGVSVSWHVIIGANFPIS